MGIAIVLAGCSSSSAHFSDEAYSSLLGGVSIPSQYGSPCFLDKSSLKENFEQLFYQLDTGKISRVEFLKETVNLCPHQIELMKWLAEEVG